LCTFGPKQPSSLPVAQHSDQHKQHQLKSCYLAKVSSNNCIFFANLDWAVPDTPSLLASLIERYLSIPPCDCGTGTLQDFQIDTLSPWILAAKTAAMKEDNPTWWQVMNDPYAQEYWKAAQIKIETLEKI
jgi:hypothetical protein